MVDRMIGLGSTQRDGTLPAAVTAALRSPGPGEKLAIAAAGVPFHATAWGEASAPHLLLLHGVTSSSATWWRTGPALAAAGYRVIAPDLPGHGETGHWTGHHRFRDNARDVAAFAEAAGLDSPDLRIVGHSWGAMTAAELPAARLVPRVLVLLDPPALPLAAISQMLVDPDERRYDDVGEAIEVIRPANPEWTDGDVSAKAVGLTQFDEAAVRAILLENGDWDGGLGGLADPAAAGLDVWLIRGDPAQGGYVPEEVLPAFAERIGADRIITIAGAPHSPQRTHPAQTVAALLRALVG